MVWFWYHLWFDCFVDPTISYPLASSVAPARPVAQGRVAHAEQLEYG